MEHFRDQVCSTDFADAIKLLQNSDLGAVIDLSFGSSSLALFLQSHESRMHEVQPFEMTAQRAEDETAQLPAVASTDIRERFLPAPSPKTGNQANTVEYQQGANAIDVARALLLQLGTFSGLHRCPVAAPGGKP
jgi:hypothetical protein